MGVLSSVCVQQELTNWAHFSTGVEFRGFRNEMTVYTDSSLDAIKRQNYQNKYRNDQITSKNFILIYSIILSKV